MIYLRSKIRKIKQSIITQYLDSKPFYQKYQPSVPSHIVHRTTTVGHIRGRVKRPWIYFRIPKAANSTLLLRLYGMYEKPDMNSDNLIKNIKNSYFQSLHNLVHDDIDNLDSYFKFTFVRNPYDRFLSCYLNKIKRKDSELRDLVTDSLGLAGGSEISINLFLEYLEQGGMSDNSHWATQTSLITLPIQNLDFIGSIERLDEDLLHVMRELGVDSSESRDVSWTKYATKAKLADSLLTKDIKRKLHILYECDFNNFEYKA